MGAITEHPTKASLVYVCELAAEARAEGKGSITINGVTFDALTKTGRCQQNVREAVEATLYGEEHVCGWCSCCAGQTARRLEALGYRIHRDYMEPGDLVYFGGGGACGTCGNPVGHAGVWMGTYRGLWQNTSYEGRGTCIIPIRDEQWNRLIGVFEILPAAVEQLVRVISLADGAVIGTVPKDGLHVEDQRKVYCWPSP